MLNGSDNPFPHQERPGFHRDFWTEELSGTRVLRDLPTLDPFEQSLYDDLRNDRLGDRVRLEQERVQYQRVEQAVLALHC